jgi:hypothetical protein
LALKWGSEDEEEKDVREYLVSVVGEEGSGGRSGKRKLWTRRWQERNRSGNRL